jgi:hypothetical protein
VVQSEGERMILTDAVVESALASIDDEFIIKWSKEFSKCRSITLALLTFDPGTVFCFGFLLGKQVGSAESMEKQFNEAP